MKPRLLRVKVEVRLKPGVLDPQGQTVRQALEALGFKGIAEVRIGKLIEVWFNGKDRRTLEKEIKEMSEKVLVNPLIETFDVEVGR